MYIWSFHSFNVISDEFFFYHCCCCWLFWEIIIIHMTLQALYTLYMNLKSHYKQALFKKKIYSFDYHIIFFICSPKTYSTKKNKPLKTLPPPTNKIFGLVFPCIVCQCQRVCVMRPSMFDFHIDFWYFNEFTKCDFF